MVQTEATAVGALLVLLCVVVCSKKRSLSPYDASDSRQSDTMAVEIDQVSVAFLEPLKTVHETRSEEIFSTNSSNHHVLLR